MDKLNNFQKMGRLFLALVVCSRIAYKLVAAGHLSLRKSMPVCGVKPQARAW